jgi:omega-hydroxy-beta-dihydromenaquinone-9 sulfotransferase
METGSMRFFAIPMPHYMAFAPLDAWWRVLRTPGGWISPKYWLRLVFVLYTSMLATVATLPERLVFWPLLEREGRRRDWRLSSPAIIVLGYYRSGTTHLHYLLSCDRRNVTPRWYQCLVPQGGPVSWSFARLFMIPFMSEKRPMDDVAYGPEWPHWSDAWY